MKGTAWISKLPGSFIAENVEKYLQQNIKLPGMEKIIETPE